MPSDNAVSVPDAQENPNEESDSGGFSNLVSEAYQSPEHLASNTKDDTTSLVARGSLPDIDLSEVSGKSGDKTDHSVARAETTLEGSPPTRGQERADTSKPSDENKHLRQTLKDKGIDPPNQSTGDRVKLDQEHGKLSDKVKAEQSKYEEIKTATDARNAPLQAQADRLRAQEDALGSTAAAADLGRANGRMAQAMRAAGLGDGKPYDLSDPKTIRNIREQIDSKAGLDAPGKEKLKADLADLEKAKVKWDNIDAQIQTLENQIQEIEDRIWGNKAALQDQSKQLYNAGKELHTNEEKITESKFSDDLKVIDKLPKEKREAVYKALEQIASDAGGPPNKLSPEQRQKLVEQLAHQIAHPDSIKQGIKGTCGLATSEFELAHKHPYKYVQYVADLATKGETATAGGSDLRIQPDLINTTNKEGELVPQDDGNPDRSLASKIFQSAAANRALEIEAQAKFPPETPGTYDTQRVGTKYPLEIPRIDPTRPKTFRPSEDTGERVVMPDGTVKQWDGMNQDDLPKLTSELTGDKYEAQHIVKGRNMDDPRQEAEAEKDFMKAIDNAGLPAKCSITLRKGDFTGMNAEGGHEIVIDHVDRGPPAMVYFENTAGGSNHSYPAGKPVPLKDFLKSMSQTKMSDGNTHAEGHIVGRVQR